VLHGAGYDGDSEEFQGKAVHHGFYACSTSAAGQYDAVGECASGTSVGGTGHSMGASSVAESGLAWNVVQSIVRHCSGSGDNVECDANYGFLESAAACLILPDSVGRVDSVYGDDATIGVEADYADAVRTNSGATNRYENHNTAPSYTAGGGGRLYTWYPGGYPLTRLGDTDGAWAGLNSRQRNLARFGLCEGSDEWIYVKYCNPLTGYDGVNEDAPAAWSTMTADDHCRNSSMPWRYEGCLGGYWDSAAGAPNPTWNQIAAKVGEYWSNPDLLLGARCDTLNCDNWNGMQRRFESANWGDFTRCSDDCVFDYNPSAMTRGAGGDRSVCINLDPYHVHQYGYDLGSLDNRIISTHGERGSPHLITRLDLTDDGPLGACNSQGSLPNTSLMPTAAPWNNTGDYITSDRGTCITTHTARNGETYGQNYLTPPSPHVLTVPMGLPPGSHPRTGQHAFFSRTLPDNDPWLPATRAPAGFCDGGDQQAAQLFAIFNDMQNNPDIELKGNSSTYMDTSFSNSCGATITQNNLGGAVCKYDCTLVTNAAAGWYVQDCTRDPVSVVISKSFKMKGGNFMCGCGVLIIKPKGGGKLEMVKKDQDTGIAWRGIVVLQSSSAKASIAMVGDGGSKSFYLDGAFIIIHDGNAIKRFDFELSTVSANAEPAVSNHNISFYVRYNPQSVNEVLSALATPQSGFRLLY